MVSETRKILENLIYGKKEEQKPKSDSLSNLEDVSKMLERWKLNYTPIDQAYLTFDGRKLGWNQGGQEIKSWPAMSGNADYQSARYQGVVNKGPIPEGMWRVNQDRYQNYDSHQNWWGKVKSWGGAGTWRGGRTIWGNNRVWLEPSPYTNARGRDNFSIHGGSAFGSAGCIDLAPGMDDFTNDYREYGRDMDLYVKYPKDF